MHAGHQVEMIAHYTETKNIYKIELPKLLDQTQQILLVRILNRQPRQGSPGYDMVNSRLVTSHKPGYAGHGKPPSRLVVEVMEGT